MGELSFCFALCDCFFSVFRILLLLLASNGILYTEGNVIVGDDTYKRGERRMYEYLPGVFVFMYDDMTIGGGGFSFFSSTSILPVWVWVFFLHTCITLGRWVGFCFPWGGRGNSGQIIFVSVHVPVVG